MKRIKTSAEAKRRNRSTKTVIKSALKAVESEKDKGKKAAFVNEATSIVDKAAGKKVIHKNKAARIKSRLSRSIKG